MTLERLMSAIAYDVLVIKPVDINGDRWNAMVRQAELQLDEYNELESDIPDLWDTRF